MRSKRLLAVLLSMALTMPVLQGMASFAQEETGNGLNQPRYQNYQDIRKAKLNGSSLSPLAIANGETAVSYDLPDQFDLRSEGLVSSVKNQNPYGTCWAHAAMASLESMLIVRDAMVDLSEWYQAYYNYSDVFGYRMDDSGNDWADQGGNYTMASSMLAGWVGVVDEADCPYDNWDVLNGEMTIDAARAQADYHVTDVNLMTYSWYDEEFLMEDVSRIQQVLYDGHALVLNYFDADEFYHMNNYSYYYNGAYDEEYGGYHAVTIVGWDDNFPASKFAVTPPGDGAWLCKNSWAQYWGDGGYFWMSYYDESIFDVYYVEGVPAAEGRMNYQHDDYGYWSSVAVDDYGDNSAWMANVFTAEEDTWLTEIMFCSSLNEGFYNGLVYTDLEYPDDPASGTVRAEVSGSVTSSGYHTAKLDSPVFVGKGETFSVAVQTGYNDPEETGWCITCESCYETVDTYPDGTVKYYDSYLTEECIRRDFAPGESFYSVDGEEWFDTFYETIYDEYDYEDENGDTVHVESTSVIGNVCVKAIGSFGSFVEFSEYSKYVPYDTEITLHSYDGSQIYYRYENGDETYEYNAPIAVTEDCKIYAWTEGGDICSRSYQLQHAQLSSLLAVDQDTWADYFTLTQVDADTWTAEYVYFEDCMPTLLNLMPISTETIRINGTPVPSGDYYTIHPSEDMDVTIEVTGENLLTSTYHLSMKMQEYDYVAVGDVNLDDHIDAVDAAEILVYAAAVGAGEAPELPDEEWLDRADFDYDGVVDAVDAAEILYYAAMAGAGEIFG
ncbi:MAG: hypothetical protein E7511_07160 [Ruminococcus sp.]|nr:hypothetical protein [Ruminococcus sp.]